ncbi:MAG TPA: class I SAM-dependent methyltransferase [Vicinamibacterales bacterium]|jgi:hypothetical protein|nr:class I SAM-dependent methyltransferase [Vicinamibacterales bacterium]
MSDWLALREPADAAARSTEVTQAIVDALPREGPVRALDLATGTGANIRFLAPRLPGPQEWIAVDRDPVLLAHVHADVPADVTALRMELGSLGDPALSGLFAGRHLVTASALLDLVSESWIAALANRCREVGAVVLFALNYDGRSACSPREPEDDFVLELFNRHQKGNDKGFGTAAGPDADDCAARSFAAAGYRVRRAQSDWALAPESPGLQRALITGWAQAASEVAPDRVDLIGRWLARRLAHVSAGRSSVRVGHHDLAAWLL